MKELGLLKTSWEARESCQLAAAQGFSILYARRASRLAFPWNMTASWKRREAGRDRASSCSRSQRPLLGFCPAGLRVWCVLGCVCGRCVVVFVCRIDSALDIRVLALLAPAWIWGCGLVPSTLML